MGAINTVFYPRPARLANAAVTGTALTVTSTAAVQFAATSFSNFDNRLDIITLDIQGNDVWVTFDGSTPSSSAAHIMYNREKVDWSPATAQAAKFVATTTTNAVIYASPFQI